MRRILLLLLLLLGINSGLQAQNSQTLTYDGLERSYSLFVPDGEVSRLLIVLHPFGSSGLAMQYLTGMNTYAQEKGFAVAYPNASTYYWDEGRSNFDVGPDDLAIDDVGFIGALADTLTAELGIESHQVYLSGMGSGGGLAYLAACTEPERYAAVAVVSTLLWDYQALSCPETQSEPINLIILWGEDDPMYQEEDRAQQISRYAGTIFGTAHTSEFWLERNGCNPEEKNQPIPNLATYPCAEETSFSFVSLANSGGIWPRKGAYQLNQYGVDASEIIARYIMGESDWYSAAEQDNPSDETPRSWILYVPSSYNPETASPLVLLLHGRGGSGAGQAYLSDFRSIAEREGLIAVFPDGLYNQWNYIRDMPQEEGVGPHDDDLFLTTLIDDLSLDLNIDQSRVYVTGYSNGGFMAQRLVCTEPNRFAAMASVAATGAYGLPNYCEGREAKPIMYIHGTLDEIVPWDGSTAQAPDGTNFYVSAPMSRTIGFWATHNGCGSDFSTENIPQTTNRSRSSILTVNGCPDSAPIIVYMVIGGGHVWPGIRETDPSVGYSSQDFNASEVIWNFFSQFALENGEAS